MPTDSRDYADFRRFYFPFMLWQFIVLLPFHDGSTIPTNDAALSLSAIFSGLLALVFLAAGIGSRNYPAETRLTIIGLPTLAGECAVTIASKYYLSGGVVTAIIAVLGASLAITLALFLILSTVKRFGKFRTALEKRLLFWYFGALIVGTTIEACLVATNRMPRESPWNWIILAAWMIASIAIPYAVLHHNARTAYYNRIRPSAFDDLRF